MLRSKPEAVRSFPGRLVLRVVRRVLLGQSPGSSYFGECSAPSFLCSIDSIKRSKGVVIEGSYTVTGARE